MSETFSQRPGAKKEELNLKKWFPRLGLIKQFQPDKPLKAQWIHASTHFELDSLAWPASTFENNGQKLPLLDFLRAGIQCELLSLGVCNSANNHFSNTPYWLGPAELLLSGGAQSLVLSRWQMDETASQILIDFYRYSRAGLSMDEALHLARVEFQKKQIGRFKTSVAGSHPYFWAGMIYVGNPGRHLYHEPIKTKLFLSSMVLTLTLAYLLLQSATKNRI